MAVKGSTVEERRAEREKRSRRRQVMFHADRVRAARNGRERLVRALNYAQAVGHDLDDAGRTELARAITAAADERRPA